MSSRLMINFGCGMTPVKEYLNFDNSPSVNLKVLPIFLLKFFKNISVINQPNYNFIMFAKNNRIRRLDVRKKLPFDNESIDFAYSSHMVEHLYRKDAVSFLTEVHRILKVGGRIRLVLPDLEKLIELYNQTKDADNFMKSSLLFEFEESNSFNKLKMFFLGPRRHQWMYNSKSLITLIEAIGFKEIVSLNPGETETDDIGSLNLFEGGVSSIFIEGVKL